MVPKGFNWHPLEGAGIYVCKIAIHNPYVACMEQLDVPFTRAIHVVLKEHAPKTLIVYPLEFSPTIVIFHVMHHGRKKSTISLVQTGWIYILPTQS